MRDRESHKWGFRVDLGVSVHDSWWMQQGIQLGDKG